MSLIFDSLSTPGYPALAFDAITGISGYTNQYPDASSTDIVIPLRLKSFNSPQAKTSVNTADFIPIMSKDGASPFGAQTVLHGIKEFPKAVMDGYIDTPCEEVGDFYLPLIKDTNVSPNIRLMYSDLIAAITEGRMFINDNSDKWQAKKPLWFRDPFGRVYNEPRIIDFNSSYAEQYPCRATFDLTLVL